MVHLEGHHSAVCGAVSASVSVSVSVSVFVSPAASEVSSGAETFQGNHCIGIGNEYGSSDIKHKSAEMSTGAKTFDPSKQK